MNALNEVLGKKLAEDGAAPGLEHAAAAIFTATASCRFVYDIFVTKFNQVLSLDAAAAPAPAIAITAAAAVCGATLDDVREPVSESKVELSYQAEGQHPNQRPKSKIAPP
jgi:hypothetical protein